MSITPEQVRVFLAAVRAKATTKAAAGAAGIHRPRVYTLRDRDPAFATAWAEARRAAAAGEQQQQSDPPRSSDASARQLLRELGQRKRRRLADFLLKLRDEPADPTPEEEARAMLDGWLAGEPWPDDVPAAVAGALAQLSPRAADDLRREQLIRAAERAAHAPDDGAAE